MHALKSLAHPVTILDDRFFLFRKSTENQLKLVVTSKNRQTDRFVGKIREFFDIVFNTYSPLQVKKTMYISTRREPHAVCLCVICNVCFLLSLNVDKPTRLSHDRSIASGRLQACSCAGRRTSHMKQWHEIRWKSPGLLQPHVTRLSQGLLL